MLVAGGTGSIGRAVAAAAADAGWRVAVHGRSVRFETRAAMTGFTADLAVPGAAAELVERAAAHWGRIDAVVDCVSTAPAGITGRFADTQPDAYAALFDASAAHFQRLAHAALPWLARQGGTLVALASDAGRFAAPNQSLIGASRAAIIGFVRNLAVEVARDGVRVHCVAPSYVEGSASLVRTEARVPDRVAHSRARAGLGLPTAEDVAALIMFLCGDGARRLTGQVISINGGLNA